MTAMIRVLIVDDSAFARKVLRTTLERAPGITVVGTARDGVEALDKIAELAPDVVTLDLVMPDLDGLGVLRALTSPAAPRVVVVTVSEPDSELGVQALQAGAVDLVQKPTALATDRLYELSEDLVRKVHAAAIARPQAAATSPPAVAAQRLPGVTRARRARLVVVGTSTGGPQALTRLIPALPGSLPVPMAVALHIPAGYTKALAKRLNDQSALDVVEAFDGLELRPGMAAIAPGGHHLQIAMQGEALVARVGDEPRTLLRPSVDLLFGSAAEAVGAAALGVVLTGMGDDGMAGARSIQLAGGQVLTEAEASCVVFGMPRSVQEAGLATAVVSIGGMADALLRHL